MRHLAPETQSRRKLGTWLRAGNSQAALAEKTGIPQQTLSTYLCRVARPPAWRAELIAIATAGAVPAEGWQTTRERGAIRRARRAA